jgi:hypothetical protein
VSHRAIRALGTHQGGLTLQADVLELQRVGDREVEQEGEVRLEGPDVLIADGG